MPEALSGGAERAALVFPRSAHELGALLRQRRKSLALTLLEAANAAGVSRQTLVSIESGQGNPRLDTLQALAEVLSLQVGVCARAGVPLRQS